MKILRISVSLFLLLPGLSLLADPFPPYWNGGAGGAIHFQPVAWPADVDWIPYSYISSDIEDAANADGTNGGTSPQNYVNISSGCTDQTLPSIYYYYDSGTDTLFFRWRVGQIANTYATGPSAGNFSSTDPWRSALWTVLIDVDGDGFREFAVHLNGSSGSPSTQIDVIQSIYSDTPSQSIDYINDPAISRIAHNPTAFVDQPTSRILNFQSALNPTTSWPNGASETEWDYGTTRATRIPSACEEFFVDYQIPMGMLDASSVGGPTLTADSPMSLLFTTANSLNNPLQKDVVLNGTFVADPNEPVPGGDPIIPSGGAPIPQPIVQSITTAGCGPVTLKAQVLDVIQLDGTTSVVDVDFYYFYDRDGDGDDDDAGSSWTFAATGSTSNNPVGEWSASWDSTALLQGNYLIGARAEDAQGNVTWSYLTQAEVNGTIGTTPPNYANPPAYGVVTQSFTNSCGTPPPSITKSVTPAETSVGGTVTFTLTVSNPTSSAITISDISDQLPTGFSYQGDDAASTLTPIASPIPGSTGLVSWIFSESIPASSSRSLVFEATAGSVTGTYSNSATATTSFGDLSSNSISVGVGAPRLTISKAASVTSASPGDTVTYTITYSNDSPVDVTGGTITDVLPTGLTFVSASSGGSYDGGTNTITWNVGPIRSGEGPFTVSFTATVDNPYPAAATIPLANTATIDSNESAATTSTSSIHVDAPRPVMEIQKDGPAVITAGSNATFTISYANSGNSVANGVTITDVIPAGWTFVSASGTNTNPGVGLNGTVTWTIGSVAAGASGSETLVIQASNPYTGADPVSNTATLDFTGAAAPVSDAYETAIAEAVGGTTTCTSPTSGSDTSDSSFLLANVLVDDGTGDTYEAALNAYDTTIYQEIVFPATVVAAGSSVSAATLTYDFFEKNLDGARIDLYVSGSFVATHTIDPTVSQNADITVTVDLVANGINTAAELNALSVRFLAHSSNTNTTARQQRTDFVQVCVTTSTPPDLVVDKQASLLAASAGDTIDYTIEFANGGGSAATGATIVDDLPAGVTFQSATLNGAGATPTSVVGQQYTFDISTPGEPAGTLNPGEAGSLVITVQVANPLASSVTELTNSATLDTNETTPIADSIKSGIIAPNLSISKSADDTLLVPGETVTYTVIVTNSGDGPATGVQVVDVLPVTGYYTYVPSSTTLNSVVVTPDPFDGTDTITVDVGTLAAGESATVTYQLTVASSGVPAGVTDHQNSASVTAAEVLGTITSDTVTVSTSTNPLLGVTKSSSPAVGPIAAGDAITYTISVTNSGSATALNVVLTDPVPSGATYSFNTMTLDAAALTDASDADAGRFDAGSNAVVVDIGSVGPGATRTVTYRVVTNAPAPAGTSTVTNSATVSSSNTSSRTATSSIDVTAEPILSVDKRAPTSLAYPLTSLASTATASTTIDVDEAVNLSVGSQVSIGGSIRTITAISGTTVTLDSAVTAAAGTDVNPVVRFFIVVQNTGSATASNLTLSDPLPAGMTYVSASPAPTSAPAVGTNGTVTWSGQTLAAGASATYEIVALPTAAGTYQNTATATATGASPASDTTDTSVGVLSPTKSTSTATVTNSATGTTATYTITVENQAATTATGVVVTDTLSPGFTYAGGLTIGGTATQTTVSNPTVGDEVASFGDYSIPAGGTLTLTFDVAIAAEVGASTYQNEVSVSSSNIDALQFDFLAVSSEDVQVLAAPEVTIANAGSVTEGGNLSYVVSLSSVATSDVTVSLLYGGTATSGSDYTAGPTSVTIPAGATSATVTIATTADVTTEPSETVTVTLNGVTSGPATIGTPSTGTGTIVDGSGTPSISINDVAVTEGNAGTTPATFTVTLSNPSTSTITVNYGTSDGTASAGADYTAGSGTITFSPGTTTQTLTIDVLGDTIDEPNETFNVNLSAPANATIADGTGVGTITDDDGAPGISINDVTVTEGDAGTTVATFTVTLSNPSSSTVTVDYATSSGTATAGTDFTTTSGTLSFAPGITTQTISVTIQGDLIDEPNETFTVDLSNPVNGTIVDGSGTGTITDDDGAPGISIDDVTVTEGDTGTTAATFTVTLSNPSASTVTVDYTTASGTATSGIDYTAASGTVTFTPGTTSQTLTINVLGDTIDESDENYTVNLTNATNATISDPTGVGTIVDDDGAPGISINDVTVTEGDSGTTTATFTVTLSNPSASTVTVDYGTAGGTATSGTDFTPTSGTLSFAPGITTQTITVDVLGDLIDESDENYTVNLTNATNATISDPTGVGTITDDDGAPGISINDVTVTEGDSGTTAATFTVTLTNPSASTVTVDYGTAGGTATSGTDFTPTSGTLSFAPGITTQTITVDVLGDVIDESNETYTVNLTNATNATISDPTGVGTITDDDGAPGISINDVTVTEGDSGTTAATFTVSLSNPSASTVTVDYATAGGTATSGTDFTPTSGTLSFAPGITTQTITVDVLGDLVDESNETYTVNLTNATNATISDPTGVGTITDDDGAPGISINDVSVTEGDAGTTAATFTVTLTNPSASTVTVDYGTAGGTATSGTDFTPTSGTLSFAPGITTQTITVDVLGDLIDESNETYTVSLTNATNATISDPTGVGTIVDDDGAPGITINDVTVTEGDSGTTAATFTVSLSNPSASTVTVDYATAGGTATSGTDFTPTSGTLSFAPGITTQTVTVDVLGDLVDESNETYTVNLTNATNATISDPTGLGTIVDDDGAPGITIDDVTVTEGDGGTTATFTVTLSNPSASTVTVDYGTAGGTATSGIDFTPTSGTLSFAPGITTRTITVSIIGDTVDESDETFTVNLTNATNGTIVDPTGVGTISDDDGAPGITINDVTVTEGDTGTTAAVFTVTLSNPSASTVTVDYGTAGGTATSGTDFTATSGTLSFAPGITSQTITVDVVGDTIDESNETYTVNLTNATNATISDPSGLGTIVDDDGAPGITIDDVTVSEGDTGTTAAVFTVTLSNPSASTVTVDYGTAGGTATSGTDFTPTSGTLSFAPGTTSQTIAVDVLGDLIDESNETYTVNLSNPTNAAITDSTGVGTITDDDGIPTITIGDVTIAEGPDGSTTSAIFTVTLSNPSASTITVDFGTTGGTATSGTDFTPTSGTLTFAPGSTSGTITVDVLGDSVDESDEQFTVNLSNPTNATIGDPTGVGTIADDDGPPSISVGDATVTEGGNLGFVVSLSHPSASTITVTLDDTGVTATSGTDYTSGPYTVTFNPGQTTAVVTVPTIDDAIDESDETLILGITGTTGPVGATTDTGTGTIVDDDGAPSVTISDATTTEGGSLLFTVSLSNPSTSTITLDLDDVAQTATEITDYDGGPWSVSFAPGETSKTVVIGTVEDSIDENDETFRLQTIGVSQGTVGDTTDTGIGTIIDNDGAPSVSIGDATTTEGGVLQFQVVLSNPSAETITLELSDVSGTATSPDDYSGGTFTVTFSPGQTVATVTVNTIDDAIDESDESFDLRIVSVQTGSVSDISDRGTGTITDNDAAPSLIIGDAIAGEGSDLRFRIALSNPSATTIQVELDDASITATSGTDYGAGPYIVTFDPGVTEQIVSISSIDDATDESDETFRLGYRSTTIGTLGDVTDSGIGTIIDDDAEPSVQIGDAIVTEGGVLSVPITLSNPSSTRIVLTVEASDLTATQGLDYNSGPYTVTFEPNITAVMLNIPTLQDVIDESDETFRLAVIGVVEGSVADSSDTGTATIIDDDAAPSVSIGDAITTEGGDLVFDVTLSNPSTSTVTITLDTSDGTATGGADYTPGPYTIIFAPGETTGTVIVPTVDDAIDESDEELTVLVVTGGTNVGDTTDTGTGTIIDDDGAPSVQIGDATVIEGGTLSFEITLSNPTATTLVLTLDDLPLTASRGTDYTGGPYTVTFMPGQTIATLTIDSVGDLIAESDEQFRLRVTGASGPIGDTSDEGTGTILDDDGPALADLTLVKDDGGAAFTPGGTLRYALTVSNLGPDTAQSVTVVDTPSPALTYLGVSGSGWSCVDTGTTVDCSYGSDLLAGETSTVTLDFAVDSTWGAATITNDATVSATTADPDLANNSGSEVTPLDTVVAPVDLAITKSVSVASLMVGDTFDFVLEIENVGTTTATNVEVTDVLPGSFSLVNVSSTRGSCAAAMTVLCSLGDLVPGDVVTITLTGTATAPGEMINTATVVANEIEAITANNASVASIHVGGDPAAIPTVSEWMMILMGLALALLGMRRLG